MIRESVLILNGPGLIASFPRALQLSESRPTVLVNLGFLFSSLIQGPLSLAICDKVVFNYFQSMKRSVFAPFSWSEMPVIVHPQCLLPDGVEWRYSNDFKPILEIPAGVSLFDKISGENTGIHALRQILSGEVEKVYVFGLDCVGYIKQDCDLFVDYPNGLNVVQTMSKEWEKSGFLNDSRVCLC